MSVEDNRYQLRAILPEAVEDGPHRNLRYGQIEIELLNPDGDVVGEIHGLGDVSLSALDGNGILVANIQVAVDVRIAEGDE